MFVRSARIQAVLGACLLQLSFLFVICTIAMDTVDALPHTRLLTTLRKRALDSLEGDDFTLRKRALDLMDGDGFGFEKRALDNLEGDDSKRALDSLEGDGFGAFQKRALDMLEGDDFGLKKRSAVLDLVKISGNSALLETPKSKAMETRLRRAIENLNRTRARALNEQFQRSVSQQRSVKRALDALEGNSFGF
uniref:Secreted RxLR effector peptide protein n=1 Tax=Ditylenchus dipsaci TaxID=166011 RepID=A0A915DEN8_9BILA